MLLSPFCFLILMLLVVGLTTPWALGDEQAGHIRIVLAGDSTVTDAAGWGAGLKRRLSDSVECVNLARGGRSSKSFRDEGLWDQVLQAGPGYVLIQFGHNDQRGKGADRETDPDTTYTQHMARYVDEVRAAGGVPVLVTSMPRRSFTPGKRFQPDLLESYVHAVRKLAAEQDVPLVELYGHAVSLLERVGPEEALEFAPPEKRLEDKTHLGPKGAEVFSGIVAAELARLFPELKPHLKLDE